MTSPTLPPSKSLMWFYRKSARLIHLGLNAIVVCPLIFHEKSVMYPAFFMTEGWSQMKLVEGITFVIWAIITQILYVSASLMSPGYLDEKLAKKFSRKKQIPETINEASSIDDLGDDEGIVDDEEEDEEYGFPQGFNENYPTNNNNNDVYIPKNQGRTFVDNESIRSVNSLATNFGKWSRLDDSNITLDHNPISGGNNKQITGVGNMPGIKIQKKADRLSLRQINLRKFKPFKNEPDGYDEEDITKMKNHSNNVVERTKSSDSRKIFSFRKRHLGRPKLNIPIRECKHCQLEQPLRCRHCTICEHCIIRFDHHCPWVANCIGERNHGIFVSFLLLQSILNWWCFRYTLQSFKHVDDWAIWMNLNSLFMLNFTLIILSGVPTTGLLFFHLYLVFTGTTTWENVSRARISYLKNLPFEVQPFDRGCMRNCFTVFFARYPVSWDRIYAMTLRKSRRESVNSSDSTSKILPPPSLFSSNMLTNSRSLTSPTPPPPSDSVNKIMKNPTNNSSMPNTLITETQSQSMTKVSSKILV